ncbi:hypothetical protein RUMCAL_01166 [Ruminococcus callidus ATCC 27760]|uniref:Uncharacterized protein n=1 Tax=Ruminococcus callidus ATCC 27760 TaxID=411473 RepID=U2MB03_9FIRM|nr:hypothetical protein RUMCAL_01166 [Ruminococcus callidus ATCC 27760]
METLHKAVRRALSSVSIACQFCRSKKICIKSICILRKICYNIKAIRSNNFACDTAYKFFPCFLKRCLRFHSAARYGICVMPS